MMFVTLFHEIASLLRRSLTCLPARQGHTIRDLLINKVP